jgi:hypothetical protein
VSKDWKLVATQAAAIRGRFTDDRSRRQIAAYLARRALASDERNERALERWHRHLRATRFRLAPPPSRVS